MTDDTRTRILDAALRLFSQRGYETSSIRDLAAEVDLTSAALYYHFPGKEACLAELVSSYLDRVNSVLADHPVRSKPSREERTSLLRDYLAALLAVPDLTRLIDRDPAISTHPEFGAQLDGLVDELLARLSGGDTSTEMTLRATAALGALRRPVLRLDIDVAPHADRIVELALGVFEA